MAKKLKNDTGNPQSWKLLLRPERAGEEAVATNLAFRRKLNLQSLAKQLRADERQCSLTRQALVSCGSLAMMPRVLGSHGRILSKGEDGPVCSWVGQWRMDGKDKRENRGWQDGLSSPGACYQAQQPECDSHEGGENLLHQVPSDL